MKQKRLLIISTIFAFCLSANAQQEDKTVVVKDNGKEEKIDLPESMTSDLDSLMHQYNAKMYLQPDTDCNMPDINPVYEASVYKERLSKLPTVIEMPYNDIVQAFIDHYTGPLRRKVAAMLGAQNFYIPVFEEALESYDLPLELKYLPVIESALNPMAKSRVGAIGLWQFMLRTAKRYGLSVNSLVDERRDIVKASYAAAHYLSDLYKVYGDWNLVIAAYNCGTNAINKAIRRSKGERDYWKIYPKLPAETRGYVPAFIAANYVMNYYCDHNICPMVAELPAKSDTIMVNRDIHFEQIAKVLNIDIETLKDLNPQYRRNIVNGSSKPSSLRLPAMAIASFIDQQDSIYSCTVDNFQNKRTEVDITEPQKEYSSSKYSSHSRKSAKRSSRHKKRRGRSVTIRQGDTLSDIAHRNGTTVSKLKRLNKIKGSSIRAGKKLKVK